VTEGDTVLNGAAYVTALGVMSAWGDDERATYVESGYTTSGGDRLASSRHLVPVREGVGTCQSPFIDDRLFMPILLKGGEFVANHLCGDDRHIVTTVVTSPNRMDEYWRVRGPGNHYVATARLTRLENE